MSDLSLEITALFEAGSGADREQAREVFLKLRAALSAGTVRAAEPDASAPSGWRVNAWVKQGILLGFRFGVVVDMPIVLFALLGLISAEWAYRRAVGMA